MTDVQTWTPEKGNQPVKRQLHSFTITSEELGKEGFVIISISGIELFHCHLEGRIRINPTRGMILHGKAAADAIRKSVNPSGWVRNTPDQLGEIPY